jgi:serine/threonine protein kinase
MDFEDDEGYQEPEGWSSSSDEDELGGDATVLAVTPYSRIVAYPPPASIARKRLLPGHRPPHNPQRELAILQYLKDRQQSETSVRHVIELLSCQSFPSGKIMLDFPLMQTDLKEIYRQRKEEIAHSPTQLDLIIRRFLEILSALEFVHRNGIIHRDVNPANILLSNDLGRPAYLADFGIAWKEGFPDDRDQGIDKYSSGVGTG